MATEYWNKPSGDILDPWGIDPVVILVISVIVTGSTTETLEGFMLPWRLKFTQYRNPVVVETCIDAGNKPNVVSSRTSLFSVEYFTNFPKGLPWANDKYQYLPFGSTVIPWGPSISVGYVPTTILSTSFISFSSNFNRDTVSSDSDAT